MLIAVVVGLSVLLTTEDAQAQFCAIGASSILNPVPGSRVRVGDVIAIVRVEGDLFPGSCAMTNGQIYLAYPDGTTVTKVVENFALSPEGTTSFDCTGPPGTLSPFCLGFTNTYIVVAADIGKTLTINLPKKGLRTAMGVAGQIRFFTAAEADAQTPDGSFAGVVASEGEQFLIVVSPGITVTEECDSICYLYGAPITFHGTVCNTGDVSLFNIAVNDVPPATINFAASKSNGQPFTGTLNAGECVDYTGSYQPAGSGTALCGPFTGTVTASGVASGVFGNPTITSAPASATCHVCASPDCPVPPNIMNPMIHEGMFRFSFMTETNRTNTIQFTDSLLPAKWQTLITFVGNGAISNVDDNITNTQRFYRVKVE